MQNIMEEIRSVTVNSEYDISLEDYKTIYDNSKSDVFVLMRNMFIVGYLQGGKYAVEMLKHVK